MLQRDGRRCQTTLGLCYTEGLDKVTYVVYFGRVETYFLFAYLCQQVDGSFPNPCAFGYQKCFLNDYMLNDSEAMLSECLISTVFSYNFKTSTFHFILSTQLVVYTHCSQYNDACECVLTIARVSLECLNETDEYLWSEAPVGISVCNSKNHLGRGTVAWSWAGCPG